MKQLKNKAKRMLAVLVSLVLIVGMLPVSAFALTEGAMILDHPSLRVAEDGSFTSTEVPQRQDNGKLNSSAGWSIPNDKQLNVWIESSEMTADEKNDGSVPPYFTDIFGRKWTLEQVALAGYATPITNSSLTNIEVILSSSEIQAAASKSNYVVDISDVTVNATEIYDNYYGYSVLYGWKCEDDGGGLTDPESYTVTYDFTLPKGLTEQNVTVYPLLEYNGKVALSIGETDGSLSQVKTALQQLEGEVYSGQPYQVPYVDKQFIGFLVFDRNRNSANEDNRNYNGFYKFTGWQVDGTTNEKLYPIGSTIEDISVLSTGDSEIKFVPKWENIIPLNDTELTANAEKLPLDLFKRNAGVSGLLSQWVNDSDATDEAVTLGKDDILHYQVSTTLNGQLIYAEGGYKDEFAKFVLTINLDDDLEFANLDSNGNATITIEPGPLKVTGTNLGNAQDNKITFDPDAVQHDVITITLGWDTGANVISVDPTVITGLDFKLKGGATVVTSSANITGYLDYYNQTDQNPRFHYEAAQDLLNSTFWDENAEGGSNTKLWYNHFHAGEDYITAFVHTLQVLDYKVKDIDLSKGNIGQVEANTVEAKVFESEPIEIRPADITVYEGGDGGYDAVVGGTGTTTSNSLPHPMFHIKAPDGVDPAALTFTNGSKFWTVISDGGDYYHFSEGEGQDKVRVTYSYMGEDGVKHTVTEDAFDPSTMGDVYGELTIELYPGENNLNDVTAKTTDGKTYRLEVGTGTLTVRAVEATDPTSEVVTEIATPATSGSATAVAPEGGTTYTLNNTGVQLPADAKPSLLFDDIIESDGAQRVDALEDAVDTALGTTDGIRHYEAKYLDLVDANNGNAWISSSNGTDIYWGYPATTDKNTNFTLVHFKDLHRDGTNSGFELGDISSAQVEVLTSENGRIENTDYGIKFHVGSGGFSPFVLVWETDNTTGGGGGGTTSYTITASAGNGGVIDPSGSVSVSSGSDKTFTITANEGYEIADVLVDGESVGAVSEYTFENVREKHTIEARFTATGEIPVADPDDTGVSDWLNTDDHISYMNGYPDNTFRPDDNMTRAEAAQMFYNLLLDQDVAVTETFSDVPADAWYADAVNTLATLGMVTGVGDGRYDPDSQITRAEFTAIAMRFADLETGGDNIFSDVAESAWYYDYVIGSIQYGWITGYPDGTFRPDATITRAEVTTIVNRMLSRSADESFIDEHADEIRQFTDLNDSYWGYYNIMEAANAHDFTTENNTETWTALR